MKTGIYSLLAAVFFFAGIAQAEVRIKNSLTEPMLFESNLQNVGNACKQNIRRQIFKYLDENYAINDTLNPYNYRKILFSETCNEKNSKLETCFYSHNVNVYKVGKSLVYQGSSYVVLVEGITPFVFAQHPDLPRYDSVLADVVDK